MYKLLLFAGTTEGRELAEYLAGCKVQVTACVATEYGETLISPQTNLTVHAGRMDRQQMQQLIQQEGFDLVIDATHPYACLLYTSCSRGAASADRHRHRHPLVQSSLFPRVFPHFLFVYAIRQKNCPYNPTKISVNQI